MFLQKLLWAMLLVMCIASTAAVGQTNDGFIGIYSDSLGTQPCSSVPPLQAATLYVVGKLAGGSSSGITGAEFRIEVTNPTGWFFSYVPPPDGTLGIGDALDINPSSSSTSGTNIVFDGCQVPSAGGQVQLGTIMLFNLSGNATDLLVKRRGTPSNASYLCPLFTLCDAPTFSKLCMTPSSDPPCSLSVAKTRTIVADDLAVFTMTLNSEASGQSQQPQTIDSQRECIAKFESGIIQLPPGKTGDEAGNVIVSSGTVAAVLASFSVEFIAKAHPGFDLAQRTATAARTGETVSLADLSEVYILRCPIGGDPEGLAASLGPLSGEVVYAAGSHVPSWMDGLGEGAHGVAGLPCEYPLFAVGCEGELNPPNCPNDALFTKQHPLHNVGDDISFTSPVCDEDMDIPEAWNYTTGSTLVDVAIMDTGIEVRHEDLLGRVWESDPPRWDAPSPESVIRRHGSSIAAIVAARTNNQVGIAGIDQRCVLHGFYIHDSSIALKDFNFRRALIGDRIDIINNSWVLGYHEGTFDWNIRIAFRDAYVTNRVLVASMGNRLNGTTPEFPAAFDQESLIAVGGFTSSGVDFGNIGNHIDVIAPSITPTVLVYAEPGGVPRVITDEYYTPHAGTSQSAAMVSGVAALLLAYDMSLYNDDVEHIIRLSTDLKPAGGWNAVRGTGRVNARKALELLMSPNVFINDETATALGGTSVNVTLLPTFSFLVKPPGITKSFVAVKRHEIHRDVVFPVTYDSPPQVWGRGVATVGYRGDDDFHLAYGWCEPVEGTITESGCTLRTYVYEVFPALFSGPSLGWAPTSPSGVKFAYSVLGTMTPTDVSDGYSSTRTTGVTLTVRNPARHGTMISFSATSPTEVLFTIYDVAGRRVRDWKPVRFTEGTNLLRWDGKDMSGRQVGSGIYFVSARVGDTKLTRKLVVMH